MKGLVCEDILLITLMKVSNWKWMDHPRSNRAKIGREVNMPCLSGIYPMVKFVITASLPLHSLTAATWCFLISKANA